jgi:hypothetical protein
MAFVLSGCGIQTLELASFVQTQPGNSSLLERSNRFKGEKLVVSGAVMAKQDFLLSNAAGQACHLSNFFESHSRKFVTRPHMVGQANQGLTVI